MRTVLELNPLSLSKHTVTPAKQLETQIQEFLVHFKPYHMAPLVEQGSWVQS